MKTTHITILTILIAITAACGYSSPNMQGAKPAIAMLSPGSATAGGPAFTLRVNGSNFAANAVVNWNGVGRATTYVSASQLRAAIPASMIMTSGSVQITVTNPATAGNGMYGGGTLAVTSSPMEFVIN